MISARWFHDVLTIQGGDRVILVLWYDVVRRK